VLSELGDLVDGPSDTLGHSADCLIEGPAAIHLDLRTDFRLGQAPNTRPFTPLMVELGEKPGENPQTNQKKWQELALFRRLKAPFFRFSSPSARSQPLNPPRLTSAETVGRDPVAGAPIFAGAPFFGILA
jgi:hypothetical protein